MEVTLVGSEISYYLKKKNPSDKLRHKKISQSKHQHFFAIKNQWKKEWLWKSNTLGNQKRLKLKAHILVGYLPIVGKKET